MLKYISLVRKNESIEMVSVNHEDGKIYQRGDKKYKCVASDDIDDWRRRVNHIMEHG